MDGNWQRLADHIRAEMDRKGMRSQRDLAHAANVSERTISDLLSGRPRKWLPRTMPAIERVLDWGPGTARRILGDEHDATGDGHQSDRLVELERLIAEMTDDEREQFLIQVMEYELERRRRRNSE